MGLSFFLIELTLVGLKVICFLWFYISKLNFSLTHHAEMTFCIIQVFYFLLQECMVSLSFLPPCKHLVFFWNLSYYLFGNIFLLRMTNFHWKSLFLQLSSFLNLKSWFVELSPSHHKKKSGLRPPEDLEYKNIYEMDK